MKLHDVPIPALGTERLRPLIGGERADRFEMVAKTMREQLDGRTVLNVNSTASGGGVAEMLRTLLAYTRGAGVDTRWAVISGDAPFFQLTKRLHNHLYGSSGDGRPLDAAARHHYEQTLRANAAELLAVLTPGDVVVLHDPQTAGLAPFLRDAEVSVVWRCHVGSDVVNEHVEAAWGFLQPYLGVVDAYVFSRAAFAPSWADPTRVHVIPPSIDPFSPKNEELSDADVLSTLRHVGLLSGPVPESTPSYVRQDGSPGRVSRHLDILQTGPPPSPEAPLVVQVSRWDRMKDMAGVMDAFARYVDGTTDAHLALVGPSVNAIADDPEGAQEYQKCVERWRDLPHAERSRVHLACVPMRDPDEAAVIVNAVQRHAAVVAQKSLAEGFGLTVTEAMWKSRPVVGSAVGGIVSQIDSGEHGLLIDDPEDLEAFGAAVRTLLDDRLLAEHLGGNARRRAQQEFLADRHLEQWAKLVSDLDRTRAP